MEKEIWALEQAWYTHHCEGTPEKAYALLHDQFLGWPAVESSVVDKDGLIAFIEEEEAEVDFCDFELDPSAVRVMGDTAINHYSVRFMGKNLDGSAIEETLHVSHTWVKQDTQWRLLSGIAYAVTNRG